MLLCGPEKILASRMQILKLCLGKSATHRRIASWAFFETLWLAAINIAGAVDEFCEKRSKHKKGKLLSELNSSQEVKSEEVKKWKSEAVKK